MKKGILAAGFLLAAVSLGSFSCPRMAQEVHAASVQSQKTPKNQFVRKNGKWYYFDERGRLVRGWYTSKAGNRYYFGKTGAAKAGILTIDGKKYCFNEKGKMLKEWRTVNGKTYFFDEVDGHMHTGWTITPAGNRYYF